jgi:hypothetical protein
MRPIIWYVFSFGIPLLGLAICVLGGVEAYRRVRSQRIGRMVAALSYLVATSLPICLALLASKLGSYLMLEHQSDVFFGEDTWLLLVSMVYYFWLAVASNLVLWLSVSLSIRRP